MPVYFRTIFSVFLFVACLATNILYFSDFRESFFAGGDEVTASRENSLPTEDLTAKNDNAAVSVPEESPKATESRVNLPLPLLDDPFLQPSAGKVEAETKKVEKLPEIAPVAVPPEKKISANFPAVSPKESPSPKVQSGAVQQVTETKEMSPNFEKTPAIPKAATAANQFHPVQNTPMKNYSSEPVWATVDSALEEPLRY
ncbi:hypothetical protein FACS189419_09220 [Planctomycetales bacterium]|nr:hypothetical protein FACS189419_09220 [Planctomycetales bacterium]